MTIDAQRIDDEIRLCGLWTKDKTGKKSKYAQDRQNKNLWFVQSDCPCCGCSVIACSGAKKQGQITKMQNIKKNLNLINLNSSL